MDLYTLAVSIDPSGVVTGVARGGAALDQLGAKAEAATKKLDSGARLSSSAFLRMGSMSEKLYGSLSSIAAITGIGVIGEHLIHETIEAQNAFAQLEAAVKSTGGAAGLTVVELDDLSKTLQHVSTYSDEAVKGAESMLLTFDKIRGDTFKEATRDVIDLAQRMGGDLQGAAIQVGKALQDPTTGLTALRRSGVSFSEAQIAVIKNLYDTGHAAQGQALILAELRKEFGGSAAAAKDTLGGALKALGHDFGDLFEVSRAGSGGAVSAINALAAGVRGFADHLGEAARAVEVIGGVLIGRYVAGLLAANAETLKLRTQVALGNAVMLDSVEAQRGAAASAVQRAQASLAASTEVVAGLQRERAAIAEVQIAERQRLAGAVTRIKSAVPVESLAPLGGAVAARDNAQVVLAMKEREAATANLIAMSQRAAATDAELATAARAVALAETQVALAGEAEAAVLVETSLAARAAAGATAMLGEAMTLLGGPIGLAILAAMAINAALDAYASHAEKAAEQTDAQRAATEAALDTAHKRAAAEHAATMAAKDAADARAAELQAVKKLSDERTAEIGKLRALNDAFGDSEVAIQRLTATKDAEIQKSKDAKEHHGAELTALNALTDAMLVQQLRAINLAAAKKELDDARANERDGAMAADDTYVESQLAAEAIRAQREAEERLTEAQKGGALALEVAIEEEEVRQALIATGIQQDDERYAQVEADIRQTIRLRRERQALGEADKTIASARADAAKTAAAATEAEHKKMLSQMQSHLGAYFADLFTKGVSSWRDMFTKIKDMFLTLLADMVAAAVMKKVAGIVMAVVGGSSSKEGHAVTGSGGNPLSAVDGFGKSAGQVGMTIAGAGLAGFGIGESLYSSSHGSVGNYARGALGGAASGAMIGAQIGGPAGAAVGAVAGLVGGILGIGHASREAQKQMEDLQKQVALSMTALRATVNHDTVAQGIASIEADREQRRKAIEDAYSGGGAGSEQVRKRNAALSEMNALEDQRIAQLREEYAVQQQQRAEDLQVRLLVAQGRQAEADALALQLAQEREYAQYVKNGADPATLALLEQVQAQEKLAAATKAATAQSLNMVSGYRLQAAIFAASASSAPASFTANASRRSTTGGDGSLDESGGDLTVNLFADARSMGSVVLRDFKRRAKKKGNSVTTNVLDLEN